MRAIIPSATLLVLAGGAAAQDSFIVGPRALGMGGAAVAVVDDHNAPWYNPAALGFIGRRVADARLPSDNNDLGRKWWGVGVDGGAGLIAAGDLLDRADLLSGIDYERLGDQGVQNAEDVRDVVRAATALSALDRPGNFVLADATAGAGVRVGSFALGVRLTAQGLARVDEIDRTNVTLGAGGPALAAQLNGSGAGSDGQIALFTDAQVASLYAGFGGSGAFDASAPAGQAVLRLDYEARQAGVSAAQVDQAFPLIDNAVSAGGGSFDGNRTSVVLRAFSLAEVPLSYGHAFGEHVAVGGSLKLMVGRSYAKRVLVFEDGAAEEFSDFDEHQQSLNVGVDLSVLARMPWFQGGLMLRNLNAPSFDGGRIAGVDLDKVTVDPQAVLGVAFVPWPTLAVAADLDLLECDSMAPGYATRRASLGVEWNPWRIVALRGGVYDNLADSDVGPVVTAGLGINLWAVHLDAAAGAALRTTEVDGEDIPREMRAQLGLMADF